MNANQGGATFMAENRELALNADGVGSEMDNGDVVDFKTFATYLREVALGTRQAPDGLPWDGDFIKPGCLRKYYARWDAYVAEVARRMLAATGVVTNSGYTSVQIQTALHPINNHMDILRNGRLQGPAAAAGSENENSFFIVGKAGQLAKSSNLDIGAFTLYDEDVTDVCHDDVKFLDLTEFSTLSSYSNDLSDGGYTPNQYMTLAGAYAGTDGGMVKKGHLSSPEGITTWGSSAAAVEVHCGLARRLTGQEAALLLELGVDGTVRGQPLKTHRLSASEAAAARRMAAVNITIDGETPVYIQHVDELTQRFEFERKITVEGFDWTALLHRVDYMLFLASFVLLIVVIVLVWKYWDKLRTCTVRCLRKRKGQHPLKNTAVQLTAAKPEGESGKRDTTIRIF